VNVCMLVFQRTAVSFQSAALTCNGSHSQMIRTGTGFELEVNHVCMRWMRERREV
jgi:hypothetical protein